MAEESRHLTDRIAATQSQGKRSYQEDSFRVVDLGAHEDVPDAALLLLADGMGGHDGGAEASAMAIEAFSEAFRINDNSDIGAALLSALNIGNDVLSAAVRSNPALEGMGCTFVGVFIKDSILYWVSVGDSPLWLFRNNVLHRLNEDHSMVPVLNAMVLAGELTPSQAERDGRRNSLRSALDGGKLDLIDLQSDGVRLQPGDCVLLATDGLETLTETQISAILTSPVGDSPDQTVAKLIQAVDACKDPSQDNTTVIFLAANPSADASADLSSTTRVQSRAHALNGPDTQIKSPRITGRKQNLVSLWLYAVLGAIALVAIFLFVSRFLNLVIPNAELRNDGVLDRCGTGYRYGQFGCINVGGDQD